MQDVALFWLLCLADLSGDSYFYSRVWGYAPITQDASDL